MTSPARPSIAKINTRSSFVPAQFFTNFLLADEVNRASARTQSAMLEAMQELGVTYDGVTRPLPQPFITFATENPIEQEGTYPLPLAQLDRFMFKLLVTYPAPRMKNVCCASITPQEPLESGRDGRGAGRQRARYHRGRETIRQTFIREEVIGYVRRLLQATRNDDSLSVGASSRSGLMLLMGAKSLARFADRDYVTPDDVKRRFCRRCGIRVVLSPAAELEGTEVDNVLGYLLEATEVPR